MPGIIGTIKIKSQILYTNYFWGPKSEIEDKTLPLLERNSYGDCLCLAPGNKGLVDVDHRDIDN